MKVIYVLQFFLILFLLNPKFCSANPKPHAFATLMICGYPLVIKWYWYISNFWDQSKRRTFQIFSLSLQDSVKILNLHDHSQMDQTTVGKKAQFFCQYRMCVFYCCLLCAQQPTVTDIHKHTDILCSFQHKHFSLYFDQINTLQQWVELIHTECESETVIQILLSSLSLWRHHVSLYLDNNPTLHG